ncbi:MAG: hypothetical protein C0399_03470 [Syntrophus sp. (in: bacteria)]|nr:hypothetical protein [Syntrophus sp. (in: bacteria)]
MEEMKNLTKPDTNLTQNLTCFSVDRKGSTHFLTCFLVGLHALYIYLKNNTKNKDSGFLVKTGKALQKSTGAEDKRCL